DDRRDRRDRSLDDLLVVVGGPRLLVGSPADHVCRRRFGWASALLSRSSAERRGGRKAPACVCASPCAGHVRPEMPERLPRELRVLYELARVVAVGPYSLDEVLARIC